MCLNTVDLNNDNLMKMTLKLLFMLDLWLDVIDINSARHVKRDKESMPVTWHPARWSHWCMSENKKRNRTIFDWWKKAKSYEVGKSCWEVVEGSKSW